MTTDSLFGIPLADVKDYVRQNPNFKANMLGYLSELRLRDELLQIPGICSVAKIPDSDTSVRGDLAVKFEDDAQVSIECKYVAKGTLKLSSTATRPMPVPGSNTETFATRLLPRGRWDILAIAYYDEALDKWSFGYLPEFAIPESRTAGFLKSTIKVADLNLSEDISECLIAIDTMRDPI